MTKYIAHASIDENGKISGGKSGDQSKKEVCIRTMYYKPWNCVLRIENEAVRNQFANNMIDIADNENIGYDQGGRNSLLKEAKKVNFDFSKITTKCECDCSSAITICVLGAIFKVLGEVAYLEAYEILVVSGNCATTSTLRARMKKLTMISVTVYTSTTYTSSISKALYGDIYLKEGSHVVCYIDDGNKVTELKRAMGYKMNTLKKGSNNNDVTVFEVIMKKLGYYNGVIDTEFGNGCVNACNAFQNDYPECGTNGKPDSSFGPKCWKKMFSLAE